MAAERVMIDTNVLLAATDEGRPEHARALAVVEDWPREGSTLYASGQILREYLVVATRPVERNGLGMALGDALANSRSIRQRMQMLNEDRRVLDRLFELAAETGSWGKRLHDANVVATMLVHGVPSLATLNRGDFAGFNDRVELADP